MIEDPFSPDLFPRRETYSIAQSNKCLWILPTSGIWSETKKAARETKSLGNLEHASAGFNEPSIVFIATPMALPPSISALPRGLGSIVPYDGTPHAASLTLKCAFVSHHDAFFAGPRKSDIQSMLVSHERRGMAFATYRGQDDNVRLRALAGIHLCNDARYIDNACSIRGGVSEIYGAPMECESYCRSTGHSTLNWHPACHSMIS